MAKKKAEDTKLTLTDEEREGLDNEGIKRILTSKAILKVAKEYKFSDEEKEEFEYLFTNKYSNSSLQNLLKIKFLLMKMMLQNYIQIIKQTLMHKIFLFLKLEKLFKEIY